MMHDSQSLEIVSALIIISDEKVARIALSAADSRNLFWIGLP